MQQEQSEPQEGSTPENGTIPSHRTETTPRRGAHRASAKAPNTATPTPGSTPVPVPPDETLALPVFITGKKGEESEPEAPPASSAPEAPPASSERESLGGALPASERGMLVFVAALLGIGTVAVVVLLGLGGFSAPPTNPATAATMSEEPTPVPSLSPAPSPSPAPPSPSPSPSPSRSTTLARITLGTLTVNDPRAFCTANEAGRARQHEDGTWFCSGTSDKPSLPFSSTDVCRWRYLDKTAYAVAADIDDPATWKCYT